MLHLAQEHIKSYVYTVFCRQTQAWFDHTPSQPGNVWLHQYGAKPQRICPDEKKCVWEQSELRASVCLPAKMCGYNRLKFSGNLHGVLGLTFSIYMAGSYSKEIFFSYINNFLKSPFLQWQKVLSWKAVRAWSTGTCFMGALSGRPTDESSLGHTTSVQSSGKN